MNNRYMHVDAHEIDRLLHEFFRKFRPCPHEQPSRRTAKLRISCGLFAVTFAGDFDMKVPTSGGPFKADITGFVDNAGNPTTDTDVPVWASSDPTVAAVSVDDPNNPQEATIALTKKPGQAQITATFGDPASGGFVVTGSLEAVAGSAVSATMVFSGPGITAP
jgi:hypothetical protein